MVFSTRLISFLLWNLIYSSNLASCALISESPAIPLQDFEAAASDLVTKTLTAAALPGSTVPNQSGNSVDVSIRRNGWISVSASAAQSISDLSVSLVKASTAISGAVTPPPTPTSICQPGVCWGNASDMSLFFWPQESAPSACLASLTGTRATFPSGLNPVSPSIYAVIVSFTASDSCNTISRAFDTFTASFNPGEISTYGAGGVPTAFKFSDLPCGPYNNASDAAPYWPHIVAPPSLFEQMGGGYQSCRLNSWPDPSITLVPGGFDGSNRRSSKPHVHNADVALFLKAGVPDGPFNNPNPRPHRHRRAAAPAHKSPRAPERTSEPTRSAG